MNTPIADFVNKYADQNPTRLHMPGHKGKAYLGCETADITEIAGADSLYEAGGIIAESEKNAAGLFGSGRTLYSTEGSSQCIRAMVYLAMTCRREDASPAILAARNAHKSFLYALALTGASVHWLWPEKRSSLCACDIPPEAWDAALSAMDPKPCAAYVTSPDYLGGTADIAAIAAVCKKHGVPLLVDNAHGAYLHFLPAPCHPLDLGAAMCCDSAHKTLPVLTGGAYLHIAKSAHAVFGENARAAMALFGSTSPSYLILQSLDLCNRYLSEGYPPRLWQTVRTMDALRDTMRVRGWAVEPSDPLRLTLRCDGIAAAESLRAHRVEPEYTDRDYAVMMATPENTPEELRRAADALGDAAQPAPEPPILPAAPPEVVYQPRQALFSPGVTVSASEALGHICGAPTVSCPPAIPIAVSGERIGKNELSLFRYYGVNKINILR